jgi:hypothetical protein
MIGLYLWFYRVLFVAREPWVRLAPGLPCALVISGGQNDRINSGHAPPARAKLCGSEWQTAMSGI